MTLDRRLNKLRQIIVIDPKLDAIFSSPLPLEEKRLQLRQHLTDTLLYMVDGKELNPPLEWIVCRDATEVFRNIIFERSVQLAGFSFLK